MAVVFMLYGHTVAALLAPIYQQGTWYDVWQFQRGLTSSLFMLFGGFAFSIATARHWQSHVTWSRAVAKRIRRFVLLILLGYSLRMPVARLTQLPQATPESWSAFLTADVLQLLGVTFIALQLLIPICRSRRVFMGVTFLAAAAVVGATAPALQVDWTQRVPSWLAPYLSTRTGSLFPVLPWSGFVLLGAGLGQLYSRWGAANLPAFSRWGLLVPGTLLLMAAFISRVVPFPALLADPFATPSRDFALRSGACLVVMAGIAFASRRISQLPRVFAAVAQESLLCYFVHICIVYGSVWNNGLASRYAGALGPAGTLAAVVFVITTTAGLAWVWNSWKRNHPRTARFVPWVVGVAMVVWVL